MSQSNGKHRAFLDFMEIHSAEGHPAGGILRVWNYAESGHQAARIEIHNAGRFLLQYRAMVPGDYYDYYTPDLAMMECERMLAEYLRKKDPASYSRFEESYANSQNS